MATTDFNKACDERNVLKALLQRDDVTVSITAQCKSGTYVFKAYDDEVSDLINLHLTRTRTEVEKLSAAEKARIDAETEEDD